MSEELMYFNGINGATGEYGLPQMTGTQLSKFIEGQARPENLGDLKVRKKQDESQSERVIQLRSVRDRLVQQLENTRDEAEKAKLQEEINQLQKQIGSGLMGVKAGIDATKLEQAGWGVIFAQDADPATQEALSDLLKLRQEQAGPYFQVYEGPRAYQPGESKSNFLKRNGAAPAGPADPDKMPYYLLIVGSPEAIPFAFQYQLDVQYAVGRIYFETLQEYASYASSVVAAERGTVRLPRQVSLFGVANPDDRATQLSAAYLVQPLLESLQQKPDWQVQPFLNEEATKAQLKRLLGGDATPALLFTASHGMEFPMGDSRQIPHQGALLCQDWPGPNAWHDAIPQDFYFAGDDLAGDASLLGLVTIHFACYGAGTPLMDEFARQAFKERKPIAPRPFVAGLPTRLLSHPWGGALAVMGHIERAWGYSFAWPGARAKKFTATFESAFERLLTGHPVGSAFEYFNERYAELSSDLVTELEEIDFNKDYKYDPRELAGLWTANNDARDYVILGDPAVRLPVAPSDQSPVERPAIEVHAAPATVVQPGQSPVEASLDKPAALSDENWQRTPRAVQEYIKQLETELGRQ